jgi:hypothetical protein
LAGILVPIQKVVLDLRIDLMKPLLSAIASLLMRNFWAISRGLDCPADRAAARGDQDRDRRGLRDSLPHGLCPKI